MLEKKVAHYEILGELGKGGMGVVYRARDTRLERDVAIKSLLPEVAGDAERLARFEREAKVLASLAHAHIGAIYGLEKQDERRFLVLELIEGKTLSELLRRGPLPVEEGLRLALHIARALEAAHEVGIVHRDLKPQNVKVTPAGEAKVLDFGLARRVTPRAAVGAEDLMEAPTLTGQMTQAGIVMGTVAYMSPEQARGEEVDHRTDIWAFGCLLYEMLTGQAAFPGATLTDILAGVELEPPDLEALPPETPTAIRRLLRRCLQRNPHDRLQSIGDARIEIAEAHLDESLAGDAEPTRAGLWSRALPWGIALLLAVGLATSLFLPEPSRGPALSRIAIPLAGPVVRAGRPALSLSPDGRHLAYVSDVGGVAELYLRPLDGFSAATVAGATGAINPFWSPDGEWLGFLSGGRLRRVSVRGAKPLVICEVDSLLGASWGPDDTILFSDASTLKRVSADGGRPESVTRLLPGELRHDWPHWLPGGREALFTVTRPGTGSAHSAIALTSLDGSEHRIVLEGGSYPQYASSGHLLFYRAAAIMAVPFDRRRLEVTGRPTPVLEGFAGMEAFGIPQVTLSTSGALAYLPGSAQAERTLEWIDRHGNTETVVAEPRAYYMPRLSPDGERFAVTVSEDGEYDVWIGELARGTLRRLTREGSNAAAIFSPDGTQVIFGSRRQGAAGLFIQPVDGSRPARRLTTTEGVQFPTSWSADGALVVVMESTVSEDIAVLELGDEPRIRPVLHASHHEKGGVLSPDGRWLAFESQGSEGVRVHVQAFPVAGVSVPVDSDRAFMPHWSRNGRELLYLSGQQGELLMSATVTTEPTLEISPPNLVLERRFGGSIGFGLSRYDVSGDGERFLYATPSHRSDIREAAVILDWLGELQELVAAR